MERLTDYLRLANQEAKTARAGGNTPFGAILVDDVTGEVLMRQGNAEGDTHDATAHAEFVLASRASVSTILLKMLLPEIPPLSV